MILNAHAPITKAHATIHTHRCSECNRLRICLQVEPCRARVLECEHRWVCGACQREAQDAPLR